HHALRAVIGELLGREPEQIRADEGFYEQGMDSGDLLRLVRLLEERLHVELRRFAPAPITESVQIVEESEQLTAPSLRVDEMLRTMVAAMLGRPETAI